MEGLVGKIAALLLQEIRDLCCFAHKLEILK
jgi:hypothetical protein